MEMRELAKWCAIVGVALLVACPSASAGRFHVYSCRTPDGGVAPVDGWSGSATGTFSYATDTCPSGGAMLAGLGDQPSRTANTDTATWAFAPPQTDHLVAATLFRAGDAAGGAAANATYGYILAGPDAESSFDICYATECSAPPSAIGDPRNPGNRVVVP